MENKFKSALASFQRARDLANGDEQIAEVKSDSKAYIAFYEVDKGLVDVEKLYSGFIEELFHPQDQDEDDDYHID